MNCSSDFFQAFTYCCVIIIEACCLTRLCIISLNSLSSPVKPSPVSWKADSHASVNDLLADNTSSRIPSVAVLTIFLLFSAISSCKLAISSLHSSILSLSVFFLASSSAIISLYLLICCCRFWFAFRASVFIKSRLNALSMDSDSLSYALDSLSTCFCKSSICFCFRLSPAPNIAEKSLVIPCNAVAIQPITPSMELNAFPASIAWYCTIWSCMPSCTDCMTTSTRSTPILANAIAVLSASTPAATKASIKLEAASVKVFLISFHLSETFCKFFACFE